MTRPIKFRAFDKKNNHWIDDFKIDKFGRIYILEPTKDGTHLEFVGVNDPDLIIMQFTGLLDKNGKKIFEGDIVKVKLNNKTDKYLDRLLAGDPEPDEYVTTDVEYMTSSFGFTITPNHWHGVGQYAQSSLEVIGNIYENPELIDK
jgi:uncharacterized phage protein (TIGR01671 family)